MEKNKKLVLENGQEYYGYSFGSSQDKICEVVFNTSMVGYQEILSDPSYTDQAVVMTYPVIGNYGMATDDYECEKPSISGIIVRDYNDFPSNFRSTETMSDTMKRYGITGLYGVDTRKITRTIREYGTCKGVICNASLNKEIAMRLIREYTFPIDAVKRVSCNEIYTKRVYPSKYYVALINCGAKNGIVRILNELGCSVTVFPWNASPKEIMKVHPDGLLISNGPGNPSDVIETAKNVRELIGKLPIMGICLGHQIIALAYGARTYKLKFGHRGGNHPVKNIDNGKIEITSQNHSYAVDKNSLGNTPLEVTHINLLDDTVEGMKCIKDKVFSVQYHPESAPGPEDSRYLFKQFLKNMEDAKNA